MAEALLQHALQLADATRELREHLEAKQEALRAEQVDILTELLSEETLLLKKIRKQTQALDTGLRKLGVTARKGGYSKWIEEQLPLLEDEEQVAVLLRLIEDTIACQEMQQQQQELMRHSLIYYQSMARFLSGVQEFTYAPPKK